MDSKRRLACSFMCNYRCFSCHLRSHAPPSPAAHAQAISSAVFQKGADPSTVGKALEEATRDPEVVGDALTSSRCKV